ncbi:MAG: hypothetical protein R3C59_09045 [Planctomycetaceae bacterium]
MSDNDNDEIDSVDDPNCDPAVQYAPKKRRILVLLLAYSAILGFISCFLPEEDSPLDFIVSLPLLILAISWCFTDAAERDHRIGRFTKFLLIFLFIVGMPIYLFQTRGIGALKAFGLAMLVVGAMCACMFVAAFATLYVGDVAGFWEVAY